MRKTSVISTIILVTALAATSAVASGTPVRLDGGETLTVLHPGLDGVSYPKILRSSRRMPEFPEAARVEKGKVLLAVLVKKDGSPAEVMVADATDPGAGLEESALEAVRHWKFRPALRKRQPVDSYMFLEISFRSSGVTRAWPVWPNGSTDLVGFQYGGIAGPGQSFGSDRSPAAPQRNTSRQSGLFGVTVPSVGVPTDSGSDDGNTPASHSSDFRQLIRAIDVDWVFYPGGLIDKRPPSQRPPLNYDNLD